MDTESPDVRRIIFGHMETTKNKTEVMLKRVTVGLELRSMRNEE